MPLSSRVVLVPSCVTYYAPNMQSRIRLERWVIDGVLEPDGLLLQRLADAVEAWEANHAA